MPSACLARLALASRARRLAAAKSLFTFGHRLLYLVGLRPSEAAALSWRDLRKQGVGGQITVFGKGGYWRRRCSPP